MKNILIGITSSIAAYKIYELIRKYVKNGYNVKTVYTPNAVNFISPLVLETLSKNPSYCKQFEPRNNPEHINLCDWADIFVIAPISANTISKFASGISDNLLTSIFCAYISTKKPVLIAPAMNENMWNNPFIQENLVKLKKSGVTVDEPINGYLACGTEGKGHLDDINNIYENTLRCLFENKLNNSKKIVVTVGGTREKIDNVRYISNFSSGKMGFALCDWAYRLGYKVKAVSTIENSKPYEIKLVSSANDMLNALKNEDYNYLIMASAVADYRPKSISDKKLLKEDIGDNLCLELVKNPDIISEISKNKKDNQRTIGFCLGDKDIIRLAENKLKNKNLDFIIANDVKTALNTNTNKVTIIDKNGKIIDIDIDTKENTAKKILEVVCD